MAVDAVKVKELRERTGLPMMECKKALETSGGDIEQAIDNLRKAGAKAQAKLSGRAANQGRIAGYISENGRIGALATLCCETEPVANNDLFKSFAAELVDIIVRDRPADRDALHRAALPSGNTVEQGITELVNQLRENISIGRFARFEADAVAQYIHFDNRKAGMVALSGNSIKDPKVAELGKVLCMHIVFTKPQALTRDDLDPEFLKKEREIRLAAVANDPKNAGKPPEIVEKIVEGQMKKLAQEVCLLEQPFIKEEKRSVREYIASSGTGVSIEEFLYAATDLP